VRRAKCPRRRLGQHPPAPDLRHWRTVRDCEWLAAHHETYLYWTMITIMTLDLTRE
jgi:hypothetical protein